MNILGKLAAAISATLLSAQVQAVEFSFLSSQANSNAYGNSYSQTVDGLTLTATAWSTTGRRGQLQTAALGFHDGIGMGVCNRDEGTRCLTRGNGLALDNQGADDLILFTFSSAVKLDSLQFRQLGKDSDFSLWAGKGSVDLTGLTAGSLGAASLINNLNRASGNRTLDLDPFLDGSYDWFIVGARIGQNDDYAALRGLMINPAILPVMQPVPEADTWAMMLAGLGLIGFAMSRKT